MSNLNLYAVAGIAFKKSGAFALMAATVLAPDQEAANKSAYTILRERYPAKGGYGHHTATAALVPARSVFVGGYPVTVTIEEPAHE